LDAADEFSVLRYLSLIALCGGYVTFNRRNLNFGFSKAALKRIVQGISLFTSAASRRKGYLEISDGGGSPLIRNAWRERGFKIY